MEMDGQTYLEIVQHARAHIERGTEEDLATAEAELASGSNTSVPRLHS